MLSKNIVNDKFIIEYNFINYKNILNNILIIKPNINLRLIY